MGDLVDVLIRTRKRVESAICKLDEDYPGRKEVVAVKARYGEFIKDMGKASEVEAVARVNADGEISSVIAAIGKCTTIANCQFDV